MWNHNTHFHNYLLSQFPEGVNRSLDNCIQLLKSNIKTKSQTNPDRNATTAAWTRSLTASLFMMLRILVLTVLRLRYIKIGNFRVGFTIDN